MSSVEQAFDFGLDPGEITVIPRYDLGAVGLTTGGPLTLMSPANALRLAEALVNVVNQLNAHDARLDAKG